MEETLIAEKEKEMREKYPEAFSDPECLPGEIWLGDQAVDVVTINAQIYRNNGLISARVGKQSRMGKVTGQLTDADGVLVNKEFNCKFYGIFANVRELIIAEWEHEQTQQAS